MHYVDCELLRWPVDTTTESSVACRFPDDKCPYANHRSTLEFDAELIGTSSVDEPTDMLTEGNATVGM